MRNKFSNFALLKELLRNVPADDLCMSWPRSKVAFGYGQLRIGDKNMQVHRAAYELAIGPIPDGLCILHKCDNPACFRPSHLFPGTKLDNMLDCRKKGRMHKAHGEKVNTAKLTEEQVREIRRRYSEGGVTQQFLAYKFGVYQTIISRVVNRQSWKHVSP